MRIIIIVRGKIVITFLTLHRKRRQAEVRSLPTVQETFPLQRYLYTYFCTHIKLNVSFRSLQANSLRPTVFLFCCVRTCYQWRTSNGKF